MPLPHTLLTDGAHDAHITFWTTALEASAGDFHLRQPWLSLAADPSAPAPFDIANVLTPAASAALIELGRGQDLGILAVIISALSLTLHVSMHAADVVIDSAPLAGGDDDAALEPVPVVATIAMDQSVRDFLKRISERLGQTYSFQAFPVALFAERTWQRPRPRTNVLVTFDGVHVPVSSDIARAYDLHVSVTRTPTLAVRFSGRSPALSPAYLAGLGARFSRILEAFADAIGRDQALDEIDLIGDAERTRLLVDYNADPAGSTTDTTPRTIHQVFEEQAARAGEHVAIQFHDDAVSYDTLNRRANQLARFLQTEYGVGRGDVVGVLTHRSPDTIVGLLAVLKAGAVHLPIDPEYPEERLQFLVADAGAKALLVHSEHFDRLASLYETPMFALDIQLASLETPDTNPDAPSAPNDLAYIIYTSGSTGQPKAVLLEHGGFVAMVRHHIDAFGIASDDRLLQFYGMSFDSSLFEIFVSLLSGATLVMVDRDTIGDPAQLSAYVARHAVTTLTLPPVYASALDAASLVSVRRSISAGDHCRVDDAVATARTRRYYNSYGPTETSVCVTHYQVDPDRQYGSRIPIGRPITGTSIYLVDDRLRLVPDGVVGEICVGGVGVARGYLNRDELTAEKFVANPFRDNERMYRTGDLGVWLPDGNLEVIGRKDNQVKIRGYRVELGEIEAVLDQHPIVRESAVLAREDESGNKRLAAYITGNGIVDTADLKTFLAARLPEFMVPSTFMVLDAMPLSANGKIDRKALASMVETTSVADPDAGRPETPLQETLAAIWQDVLSVARVGIHDNVFDLGGDSILIIQIVSRAREAGIRLAPNQLFDHQTIAALSAVAGEVAPAETIVAEQGPVEGPAPLAPMQAWFFEQQFADAHHFNQSVVFELPAGGIDVAAAKAATAAVLEHHDALRLRFTQRGDRWEADYAPVSAFAAAPPFDVVDIAAARRADELPAAVAACQSSFDLGHGPLVRVRLLVIEGEPSRLLVVAHHLVIDGVSWRILMGDFSTAYAQAARGEQVVLPPKTSSFRDWTSSATARAATINREYWLTPHPPVPALPVDLSHAIDANTVASAGDITRTLDAATTTSLLQDVPRLYTTEINDVLIAGLALTLQGWTGADALLIDLEAHGREELVDDADTSRTVGWFTAQYPVRLAIGTHATPGDTLKSVKEQLRAVPHRGAGYGVLRYLSADANVRDALAQRQSPEILFNYFGQAGRVLAPELQWTLVPGATGGDLSPRARRPHLIEINAMVTGGCLTVTWTFSTAVHRADTIATLAARYDATLRAFVEQGKAATTTQYTPSDFPASGLDQQALDALLSKLNR